MPEVTVLMPVYNAERYLRSAIESILTQTYADFKFLIINDGSTDTSHEIISSYADPRIRLVNNECNLGLTRTLNRGLCLAQNELIARQDADDVSHPRRLEQQVCFLRDHPEVVLVGTQGRIIDQAGKYLGPIDRSQDPVSIRWKHFFDNEFIHTSVMFRKSVIWNELGGYNESFSYCQDYELWSRVTLAKSVTNLCGRLIDYRVHSSSMSAFMQKIGATENVRVIHRNLNAVFGDQAFSEEEIDLLSRYRLRVDEVYGGPFIDLFCRLEESYKRLFPETALSRDFRRTIALQYAELAYGALTKNRSLAYRFFAKSIRNYPTSVLSLPWSHILAVLGKAARRGFNLIF